ncbi:MAG: dihydrodipicolinate synthase family protein, partial [Candidatus Latescibacteria bacterium]|nr:dihydrodipicolinate synthase family protein [Candidatus Latescibacterota bacterium]
MRPIDGIVPVLPIPFDDDGGIDESSLRRVVEFCVDHRASAVCLPAYGGEFYKLSESERVDVVRTAVDQAAGRVPVIGQVNHASQRVAIALARQMQDAGVAMLSMAVPRVFGLGEDDLLRHFIPVARAIDVPLLLQDFNPGGRTVGADFARRLHEACPNFQYLKLEEPMMGEKVKAIIEATGGRVGVLEGWGGMYMMELIPAGICGVMPGVTAFPILDRAYRLARAGRDGEAYDVFIRILPFIVFQLQHLELFLHLEKRLLHRLGLLETPHVREATLTVDPISA